MQKILYIDTETTGIDSSINSIIQIAGIIEIDNTIVETFNFKVTAKEHPALFNKVALQVNGISAEDILEYPSIASVVCNISDIFDKYVDKYSKSDKFILCCHGCDFDIRFFLKLWGDSGQRPEYLFSYINSRLQIDTLWISRYMKYRGLLDATDNRLETICTALAIELYAHDAFSDIHATRAVLKHFDKFDIKLQEKYND